MQFGRNLTWFEIVDQALHAQRLLRAEHSSLTHVVFMGMGEPMANYTQVVTAIRWLVGRQGLGMSPRRIVVSTAGLIPGILSLSQEGLPLTLAISLHSARDELRNQLVPVNRKYSLEPLMAAAHTYFGRTGRRVSFEYTLLAGVNDGLRDLDELARLLGQHWVHLNVIPYNPVPGLGFGTPSDQAVAWFVAQLEAKGVRATVRETKGRSVDAACGQLSAQHQLAPTEA